MSPPRVTGRRALRRPPRSPCAACCPGRHCGAGWLDACSLRTGEDGLCNPRAGGLFPDRTPAAARAVPVSSWWSVL